MRIAPSAVNDVAQPLVLVLHFNKLLLVIPKILFSGNEVIPEKTAHSYVRVLHDSSGTVRSVRACRLLLMVVSVKRLTRVKHRVDELLGE